MRQVIAIALVCLINIGCTASHQQKGHLLAQPAESPADVYVELAVGYMRMGNNVVALENLKKGLKVDSRSSSAHGVIAVLYERLGERPLAERHFKRSLSLSSGNVRTHNNYGRFLCGSGQAAKAAAQFKLAYENPLNQKRWLALTNAGQCELRNNHFDEAEPLFRQVLAINPRSSSALLSMAKIRFGKGNFLSVRAYLQRFRELSYHTAETLWLGIQSEHELGQPDAVAGYVITLRAKFPDSKELKQLENKFPQYR